MEDGIRQAYSKAIIEGEDGESGRLDINGNIIKLRYGYPGNATPEDSIEKIVLALADSSVLGGNGQWKRVPLGSYDFMTLLPEFDSGIPENVYTLSSVDVGTKLENCFVAYGKIKPVGSSEHSSLVMVIPCT